jgi:hypothetical protein
MGQMAPGVLAGVSTVFRFTTLPAY